jgi:hypothetical protein
MNSQLQPMLAGTGLTVISKARETTGPDIMVVPYRGTDPTLGTPNGLILDDLLNPGSLPDVVLIGYSASALSYLMCTYWANVALIPGNEWLQPFLPSFGVNFGSTEAAYVLEAARLLKDWGIPVLLAKGPGADPNTPIGPCLNAAFRAVADLIEKSGFPYMDWDLLKENNSNNWTTDHVHVSCDRDLYPRDWQEKSFATYVPPYNPCDGYDGKTNGARTIAERVKERLWELRKQVPLSVPTFGNPRAT